MSKIQIAVDIDDVHPASQFDLRIEHPELLELHKQYGLKFTLFMPSNCFGHAPISKHKSWFNWLRKFEFYEIACHGHFHRLNNKPPFQPEFVRNAISIDNSMNMMFEEFNKLGYRPLGIKPPGYTANEIAYRKFETCFEWLSDAPRRKLRRSLLPVDVQHCPKKMRTAYYTASVHNPSYAPEDKIIYLYSHAGIGERLVNPIRDNYDKIRKLIESIKSPIKPAFVSEIAH